MFFDHIGECACWNRGESWWRSALRRHLFDRFGFASHIDMWLPLIVFALILLFVVAAAWWFVRVTSGDPAQCVVACRHGEAVLCSDRTLRSQLVHQDLMTTRIEGLLTSDECRHLVEHVAPAAAASGMTQSDTTERSQRSSTVLCLRHQRDDHVLAAMLSRLAELLQVPEDWFEECQMVLYDDGNRYGLHHDCLEPRRLSRVPSHQRLATVLVYLVDVPSVCGGKTSFPRLDFEVQPEAGTALFWMNVDGAGQPDPRAVHEAQPIRKSYSGNSVRKVALNVWLRGEAWNTPTTQLRILLKHLAPRAFPDAEVAQTYCPNCGVYIATSAQFGDKECHARHCPIHSQ